MKILVFTTLFPNSQQPNKAVFVKERIVNLAKRCDVKVVAPVPWHTFSQAPKEENIEGIKVYHPRYFITPKIFRFIYGFFMFLSVRKFVKKLQRESDFDLIDSHFVYPDGLAAVLLGKLLKKKVVVTARGTDIHSYSKSRIRRRLIKYTLEKADAVISVSQSLKEEIIKLGIREEKIKVIPNGVDFNKFYPISKEKARQELNLRRAKKIILSVGNLVEGKGFQFLIEAMGLVKRQDVELLIIGKGEYRGRLKGLIRENKDKVKFIGERPHRELYRWYSAADLFCLTSLKEGRPNVVLEALACGTPVLSMDKWGLSTFINEDRGLLLNEYEPEVIAKAINEALNKNWDRQNIADFMKQFGWDKTAGEINNLFENVVNKNDILLFSSDDWDSGLKTSKYHLATRLAKSNRVFFINSLSLRTPEISKHDFRKISAKLSGFFKGTVKVRENLYVYTPITIPFHSFGFIRFLNNLIVAMQIKSMSSRFGIKAPFIWTFLPNSLGVARRLPRKALVYYCVDDMSAFKGVSRDAILHLDRTLAEEADVVFTVSKELYDEKRQFNRNTFYSPHGVDFNLFNKAVTEKSVEEPQDIKNLPRPIIGFYGLISSDWVDYKLVRFLSEARPGWSFVFVGKVDKIKELPPETGNIHYLPVKPYEDLYKYSRLFDVAILPFNINKLTLHSHPLKILEYLSAGKPVVSIKIPEVMNYKEVIEIAEDYQEFLAKIEKSLKENSAQLIQRRVDFASSHSWEKRFNEIQETVFSHI